MTATIIDGKAFALEPGCKGLAQRGFVFDQKDTHELSLVSWVWPGGLWGTG